MSEKLLTFKQQGSLLIEGMVAFLILILGILGIISIENLLLKESGKARQRIQASMLAVELIGMAVADSTNSSCYVVPTTSQPGCASPAATGFTNSWVQEVTSALPNSSATATLIANGTFTVTLQWKIQQDPSNHSYVATTQIGG